MVVPEHRFRRYSLSDVVRVAKTLAYFSPRTAPGDAPDFDEDEGRGRTRRGSQVNIQAPPPVSQPLSRFALAFRRKELELDFKREVCTHFLLKVRLSAAMSFLLSLLWSIPSFAHIAAMNGSVSGDIVAESANESMGSDALSSAFQIASCLPFALLFAVSFIRSLSLTEREKSSPSVAPQSHPGTQRPPPEGANKGEKGEKGEGGKESEGAGTGTGSAPPTPSGDTESGRKKTLKLRPISKRISILKRLSFDPPTARDGGHEFLASHEVDSAKALQDREMHWNAAVCVVFFVSRLLGVAALATSTSNIVTLYFEQRMGIDLLLAFFSGVRFPYLLCYFGASAVVDLSLPFFATVEGFSVVVASLCKVLLVVRSRSWEVHIRRQYLSYIHYCKERAATRELLSTILPHHVLSRIESGDDMHADHFPEVVVLVAQISQYNEVSAQLPPSQTAAMTHDLFLAFDRLLPGRKLDFFGLDSVGSSGVYAVVFGMDMKDGVDEVGDDQYRNAIAEAVLCLAADMITTCSQLCPYALRVGIGIGPAVGGVLGVERPLYGIYGEAMTRADSCLRWSSGKGVFACSRVRDVIGSHPDFNFVACPSQPASDPIYHVLLHRMKPRRMSTVVLKEGDFFANYGDTLYPGTTTDGETFAASALDETLLHVTGAGRAGKVRASMHADHGDGGSKGRGGRREAKSSEGDVPMRLSLPLQLQRGQGGVRTEEERQPALPHADSSMARNGTIDALISELDKTKGTPRHTSERRTPLEEDVLEEVSEAPNVVSTADRGGRSVAHRVLVSAEDEGRHGFDTHLPSSSPNPFIFGLNEGRGRSTSMQGETLKANANKDDEKEEWEKVITSALFAAEGRRSLFLFMLATTFLLVLISAARFSYPSSTSTSDITRSLSSLLLFLLAALILLSYRFGQAFIQQHSAFLVVACLLMNASAVVELLNPIQWSERQSWQIFYLPSLLSSLAFDRTAVEFSLPAVWTVLVGGVLKNVHNMTLEVLWSSLSLALHLTLVSVVLLFSFQGHKLQFRLRRSFQQEQEKSKSILQTMLPRSVQEQLKDGVRFRLFGEVTVLVCAINGFDDAMLNVEAEKCNLFLNQFSAIMDGIVKDHAVFKIDVAGGKYVAVGGLPNPAADHAEGVVRLARDMLSASTAFFSRWRLPLSLRIGIHSGRVAAGVAARRLRYQIWGEAFTIAEELCSQASDCHCLISEDTILYLHPALAATLGAGHVIKAAGREIRVHSFSDAPEQEAVVRAPPPPHLGSAVESKPSPPPPTTKSPGAGAADEPLDLSSDSESSEEEAPVRPSRLSSVSATSFTSKSSVGSKKSATLSSVRNSVRNLSKRSMEWEQAFPK